MHIQRILAAVAVASTCTVAAADEYDFYAGLRYPGAKRRADVDLYKVRQSGRDDPKAYERREVTWWPRRGVDIVAVQEGMPLRTWTLRTPQLRGKGGRLRAHLVGFRGMGNTITSKFSGDGGPREPGVVLRLPDGRKRCFVRGSLGPEDKKYVMGLYLRQMRRIKAGLDKTPRRKRSSADIRWPNNAKPGEPGTMQVESEHFVYVSGSQAGSSGDPWVNEKAPDKAEWYRRGTIECAEYWWAMMEHAGNLMPYWDRREKLKYEVTVAGTKRDGHQVIGGYAGGGYGGCILKGAVGGPWSAGLWHEWGHGALSNHIRIGGGEAQADAHQCLADPSILKGNHHLKTPWRNPFNGSMGYGYTVFYNITGDDPNWGYAWFACLPYGVEETSVLQAAARVGQQRGLFRSGIRGVGDMVGEYAARLATFDCELEDLFCRRYFAAARSWLETVDRAEGLYRIPWDQAPEPFGVNINRLVPEDGAKRFTVDFRGSHNGDCHSDWRACIVAVGYDGKRRYSPLWNKGPMTMDCRADDCAYWLTVAATPTALYAGGLEQTVYSGRHAYRYPWSVRLTGARPGTPRNVRADLGRRALLYGVPDAVPLPPDTPAGKRHRRELAEFLKQPSNVEGTARAEIDRMKKGRRHANGGGWVAEGATVAGSAFVGPDAMVLGGAKVLDQAVIEDFAVVTGNAVVSGHARVSGSALVRDGAKVGGYSRVWDALGGTDIATEVPKRLGDDRLHEFALWANYAMDRDESTLLEDWYRYPRGADRRYGRRLGPNLNGYLYGRPEFVVEGEHRGFRFDGKGQYGELSPRVADLGAITVQTTIRREGRGGQTVFDFGSSVDNRFVLKAGPNGKPELEAHVKGKAVFALEASKVIPPGAWVRLRVEIDGRRAALWMDGVKVGEKATRFRPCDAFPGGQAKRNFVAASRDGSGHFKGVIDHVVVYHTVHDDFAKLPPPTRDAPIRPAAEFVQAVKKAHGNLAELDRKIRAGVEKISRAYPPLKARHEARIRELKQRDPAFLAAEAALKAAKDALGRRKNELGAGYDALRETVATRKSAEEMRKQSRRIREKVAKLEADLLGGDEELKTTRAERDNAEQRRRALDRELREAFERQAAVVAERAAMSDVRKQIDDLRREAQNVEKDAGRDKKRLEALHAKRRELEERHRTAERALHQRFETSRDGNKEYAGLTGRVAELDRKRRDREATLRKELRRTNPTVRPLERKRADLDRTSGEKDRAVREKRELYIVKQAARMVRKVGAAEKALQDATGKALAPYYPEKLWIGGFAYQGYRGYYNTNYARYIRDHVRAQVGGGQMREDVGLLERLEKAFSADEGWHTRVDWDWRMRQEVDGTVEDLPLLRKWIRRARGPVVTDKPAPLCDGSGIRSGRRNRRPRHAAAQPVRKDAMAQSAVRVMAALMAAVPGPAGPDASALKTFRAKDWTVTGLEMKMKLIPPGSFIMGSPKDELSRRRDEVPHKVTISKPMYVGVHEVTQRQFYRMMMPPDYDYEAWQFKRGPLHDGAAFCYRYNRVGPLMAGASAVGGPRTDLNPMECVTWERSREFCRKLTRIEREAGRLPEGYLYRLPTEAEWEYACRAGTKGPYNVKGDHTTLSAIRKFAWVDTFSWTVFGTRPVGDGRKPNAWGLHDMHGNVYEWCLDWYGPYAKGPAVGPTGPTKGTERVVRGGCFAGLERKGKGGGEARDLAEQVHPFLRSAARYGLPPDISAYAIVGFRVVLAPEIR